MLYICNINVVGNEYDQQYYCTNASNAINCPIVTLAYEHKRCRIIFLE